ncbi:MAG: hypothetical protein OEY96_12850 [Gammaproteobacteria bacterium]|nr:hypothetical protein [Gammaproteobacteria bacterium]
MKAKFLISIIILFFANFTFGETYNYKLQFVSSEVVVPVIRPHLDQQAKITASGYQLFIDTTPDNFKKIKEILHQLDKISETYKVDIRIGENPVNSTNKTSYKVSNNQPVNLNFQVMDGYTAYFSFENRQMTELEITISKQPNGLFDVHLKTDIYQPAKDNKGKVFFQKNSLDNRYLSPADEWQSLLENDSDDSKNGRVTSYKTASNKENNQPEIYLKISQ